MRCNPLDGGDPVWSAAARAHKPDDPSLDDARDRAVTNTPRPMSAIVIQCSRGWQPAHQGVIPGQVGHPFLIIRKLADRGRNARVRTVMSDQSLAATVGLQGGLIPRGASAPGDRPVARHRCGYRVILRESPLFLHSDYFQGAAMSAPSHHRPCWRFLAGLVSHVPVLMRPLPKHDQYPALT